MQDLRVGHVTLCPFNKADDFDEDDTYSHEALLNSFAIYGELGLESTDSIPSVAQNLLLSDGGFIVTDIDSIKAGETYIITYVDVDRKQAVIDEIFTRPLAEPDREIPQVIDPTGPYGHYAGHAQTGAYMNAPELGSYIDAYDDYSIYMDYPGTPGNSREDKIANGVTSADGVLLMEYGDYISGTVPFCGRKLSRFDLSTGDVS